MSAPSQSLKCGLQICKVSKCGNEILCSIKQVITVSPLTECKACTAK